MISESKILDHAHQVLRSEAEAILAIDNHLDDSFVKAVELILKKVRTFSWTFFYDTRTPKIVCINPRKT